MKSETRVPAARSAAELSSAIKTTKGTLPVSHLRIDYKQRLTLEGLLLCEWCGCRLPRAWWQEARIRGVVVVQDAISLNGVFASDSRCEDGADGAENRVVREVVSVVWGLREVVGTLR